MFARQLPPRRALRAERHRLMPVCVRFGSHRMILENLRHCTFSSRLDCRYLLYAPEAIHERTRLVVALHGFSSNPDVMMRLTGHMMGDQDVIAAVEGPN